MLDQTKKDDVRVVKTINALMDSISALLQRKKFVHITVNDICEQAQISRTTFYTYFSDKYDLLEFWLIEGLPELYRANDPRPQIEQILNYISVENASITRNLLEDASNETLTLYQQFILNRLTVPMLDDPQSDGDVDGVLTSIFCAGGIASYILWMVKKRPNNAQEINRRFKILLKTLLNRETNS